MFDLLAAIPLTTILGKGNLILDSLQLLKLLSISKVDINLGQSEIVKVLLRLVNILLSLMLYIHCSTCLIYYIAEFEETWVPPNCQEEFTSD